MAEALSRVSSRWTMSAAVGWLARLAALSHRWNIRSRQNIRSLSRSKIRSPSGAGSSSAAEFGGDPRRVAISGSSAGGHLAVGVTLLARERDAQAPLLQLLTYPVIDPGLATASYAAFAHGPFLTRARMAWFWKQYTG